MSAEPVDVEYLRILACDERSYTYAACEALSDAADEIEDLRAEKLRIAWQLACAEQALDEHHRSLRVHPCPWRVCAQWREVSGR